ncbi:MAG: transglutaminase family protein [Chloroflexota bacterium]
MDVRVGCDFQYETRWPTATVMQVQPHTDGQHRVIQHSWQAEPDLVMSDSLDLYGNTCRRFTMPAGRLHLRFDAVVTVSDEYDEVDPNAPQMRVEDLPGETLLFTLPSRYCLSDVLSDAAWNLFGATEPGWNRVQAICDWVHDNVRFQYGTSTPLTTAVDIYENRVGVCRDFAHLAVTFCRAMNIPARYVFGYLPDIGVPPPNTPMDFCAWFEAYLGGRWRTFDPRNNQRRVGRVVIGRGRDALDVAMVTTYGPHVLREMVVWADEAKHSAPMASAAAGADQEPA